MRLEDLRGRHVAVWGAGVEGTAAVALLLQHGATASVVVVVDAARPTDPMTVHGVEVVDLSQRAFPTAVEVILKSPGISPYHGGLRQVLDNKPAIEVFGGTALWFAEAAAAVSLPLSRTIAVTGSKGKSTTCSLIAHLLSALTDDVLLAGNVGRAPLDVLAAGLAAGDAFPPNRWHVLELSSFQTSEVGQSPAVGVLTSLFPEHLDWHETVDRYFADKINLFCHPQADTVVEGGSLTSSGDVSCRVAANVSVPEVETRLRGAVADLPQVAVVPYGDGRGRVVKRRDGVEPEVEQPIGPGRGFMVAPDGSIVDAQRTFVERAGIPLVGHHNAANLCGALSALRCAGWEPWDHREALLRALLAFRPLDHRLQPVGVVGGRDVIDDSLSTAPQAAIAALAAFEDRPVGIIIGGHDRGLDYQALADAIAVRQAPVWVVGVPQSGPRIGALIHAACQASGNTNASVVQVDDFDAAVPVLLDVVPEGGVLLLSPAAPSFGRFADYRERGMRFRSLLGLA